MKFLVVLLSTVLLSSGVFAQGKTQYSSDMDNPNAISIELLGRAGVYSLNYDHLISDTVGLGFGLSYYSLSARSTSGSSASGSIFVVPTYFNYYLASGPSHVFLTAGLDLIVASVTFEDASYFRGSGVAPIIGVGYEYRSAGGFLFRIALPYITFSDRVLLWGGVSLGAAF